MIACRDPFRRHRFPKDVISLAVRWYCRYSLSYRDVCDMLPERGIVADAARRALAQFGLGEGGEEACGQPAFCVGAFGQRLKMALEAEQA